MEETTRCVACDSPATQGATVASCDGCATLVQAALAGLQPTASGERADSLSPMRQGVLVRARWLARQLARTVDALAREDVADADLRETYDEVDTLFGSLHGHTPETVVAMRVIDQVEFGAELVRRGLDVDAAAGHVGRQFAEVWPDYAARIPTDVFVEAVRDWAAAEAAMTAPRSKPKPKWKSAYLVLEKGGLCPRSRGDERTAPWEKLRREWRRWRRDGGGRATEQRFRELRGPRAAGP